jgi:hypothetical protein
VGRHERQPPARYYRITKLGSKQLATEVLQFDRVIGAIRRVLKAAAER